MDSIPDEKDGVSRRAALVAALAALLLATLLLYSSVSNHGFLRWDDNQYVTENPHVITGLSASNIAWAFHETATFYWHPLTFLSHMLDCQLFGLSPGPHHLVNLLLHALNVLLTFLLLYRATGALWRSCLVAALFALHPLNVETVAWLSERKSLLSAFFSLLTFAAYGSYVQRRTLLRYALVVTAFCLALMAKPMAVTIPVLLLILDFWPLQRDRQPNAQSWGHLLLEKVPLLLLSVGSAALTILGQRSAGAVSSLSNISLGMRLEQAVLSYVVYLRKIAWPSDLSPFYPYHPHWLSPARLLGVVALLAVVTLLVFWNRKRRYLVAGWLWFIVVLFPVSGIVQVGRVVIADRFVYVAELGIFVAITWLVAELVSRTSLRAERPALVAAAAVLFGALVAHDYLRYWKDGVLLFTRAATVEKAPDPMIETIIADHLIARGETDPALQHYVRACELDPRFDLCHFNIAEILFSRYDARSALEHYQLAGRYTANPALALRCLVGSAEALASLGELELAEQQLANALAMQPDNVEARQLLEQVRAHKSAP